MKVVVLVMLAALVLSTGCVTPGSLSQSKKQILIEEKLSIAPVKIAEDAYKEPDGSQSPNASTAIPQATMGGAIPALLGSLIDSTVVNRQQKKFEAESGQYFEKIKEMLPSDLAGILDVKLQEVLKADPFFSKVIDDESKKIFSSEVTSYGLSKSIGNSYSSNKLAFIISMKIEIGGPDQKLMVTRTIDANSSQGFTLEEYANDPSRFQWAVEDATRDLIKKFEEALQRIGGQ